MSVEITKLSGFLVEFALALFFILFALRVLRELSRPSIEVQPETAERSSKPKSKRRDYSNSVA